MDIYKGYLLSIRDTLIIKALGSFYVRLLRETSSGIMDVCNATLQFSKLSYMLFLLVLHVKGLSEVMGRQLGQCFTEALRLLLFLNS